MAQFQDRSMAPADAILVFGAGGHVGGPVAERITAEAPHIKLRLATSKADSVAQLERRFPAAEVVVADYFDLTSLIAATDGIDTMFVITPDFIDERRAMINLVAAINRGTPRHIVRLTGDPPHVHREEQSAVLAAWPNGVAVNHLRARAVLEDSRLPVTFLNVAGYYMDNLARTMIGPILATRTLVVPFERRINFIDPRDVGGAAARLLLANDRFHIGKTYHLDNGRDCLTLAAVAELMSDVLGEPIGYDPCPDSFRRQCGPMIDAVFGAGMIDYVIAYMGWEQESETIWRRTDILEALFKLEGRSLRDWLIEHKAVFAVTAMPPGGVPG